MMKNITCIDDLRDLHMRRVPKAFFDYCDRGSYTETTLRANREDLSHIKFRQRILVDVASRSLNTTILGEPAAMPIALAPIGLTGMQHGDGEIYACRAAHDAGIPYTLSTMSICSIEDVASNVKKPFWFQLYMMKDRGFMKSLIERAIAGKCKTFGNLAGQMAGTEDLTSLSEWISTQFDPSLSWKDIEWIRNIWPGKMIIKGILDIADAREAVKTGAEAMVVSNHGGRQLDGAPSSISVLPEIVQELGSQIEIMFDGGIRTGQDVLRALALGAKSCMIGRAYVHGLGAGGQAGVAKAIDIIGKELSTTMGLCGISRIADIDRRILIESRATNA